MKLREYHPLSEMERVPAEELPKRLDELFDRMDKENVGFVVTEEGKDSCVFCPYKWFELEYETIEVAVDEGAGDRDRRCRCAPCHRRDKREKCGSPR